MLVHIVNDGRGNVRIHRPNCGDIPRQRAQGNVEADWQEDVVSVRHLIAANYCVELADADEYDGAFEAMPCSHLPYDPPGWGDQQPVADGNPADKLTPA